jgi:hypothetical protein
MMVNSNLRAIQEQVDVCKEKLVGAIRDLAEQLNSLELDVEVQYSMRVLAEDEDGQKTTVTFENSISSSSEKEKDPP